MAKRRTNYTTGKSTQTLMELDTAEFLNLNQKDLKAVVGRLASTASKRVKYFEKYGESSPAIAKLMDSGNIDFKTYGKTINQLRRDYKQYKQFLSSKVSTWSGWQAVKQQTIDTIKKEYNINISNDQFNRMWAMFEELKKNDSIVATVGMKYRVLQSINRKLVKSDNPDEDFEAILDTMKKRIKTIYEGAQMQDKVNLYKQFKKDIEQNPWVKDLI